MLLCQMQWGPMLCFLPTPSRPPLLRTSDNGLWRENYSTRALQSGCESGFHRKARRFSQWLLKPLSDMLTALATKVFSEMSGPNGFELNNIRNSSINSARRVRCASETTSAKAWMQLALGSKFPAFHDLESSRVNPASYREKLPSTKSCTMQATALGLSPGGPKQLLHSP